MKKTFIALGILAFASANGQQKDLFNIDTYLKNKLNKKEHNNNLPGIKLKEIPIYNLQFPFQHNLKGTLSHALPNGEKVYSLGLDNMPCVVPDMKMFTMPNKSKNHLDEDLLNGNSPGRIPNVIKPQKLIIAKK